MAAIWIAYGPCRCQTKGIVYITYDDDPEIAKDHPPVASCDQCSTPSEALLYQTGFQR
jgi:hypothetical protein